MSCFFERHKMNSITGKLFLFLTNLAYTNRYTIPALVTAVLLVFDIRLQIEINVEYGQTREMLDYEDELATSDTEDDVNDFLLIDNSGFDDSSHNTSYNNDDLVQYDSEFATLRPYGFDTFDSSDSDESLGSRQRRNSLENTLVSKSKKIFKTL